MNNPPRLQSEPGKVVLTGEWTLAALLPGLPELQSRLAAGQLADLPWDLSGVDRLDSAAAVLLWRTWNERWPADLIISDTHRHTVERVSQVPVVASSEKVTIPGPVERVGNLVLGSVDNASGLVTLFGQMLLDLWHLARHPSEMPWKEIAANIYKAGALALPVTGLVGFLIGVTLSYLSALQ